MDWLFLVGGLILLTSGAQAMVTGGVSLALRLGLSPLIIGLTLMAYGTSSPELVVSVQASLRGSGALAVGNVLGSNLCNLALILGICALIRPIITTRAILRREVPILVGASVLGAALLWNGYLVRWEGLVFVALLVLYTWLSVVWEKRRPTPAAETADELPKVSHRLPMASLLMTVGLGLLLVGSDLLIRGAVSLAATWGISEAVIGLTLVAIGTSLPELALSVVAAARGHADMAVGNVVGSSTFNILGILGATALTAPVPDVQLARTDLIMLVLVAVVLVPLLRTGHRLSRFEGGFLVAAYAGYLTWIVIRT
jgi:cation:H+ antiporter